VPRVREKGYVVSVGMRNMNKGDRGMEEAKDVKLEPVKYDVAIATINKLREEASELTIVNMGDTTGYKMVHAKRMEARGLRLKVEERRKGYKSKILEYGRLVDGEANKIKSLLSDIESDLQSKQDVVDEAKKVAKEEKERLKRERVQQRTTELMSLGFEIGLIDLGDVGEEEYEEIRENAIKAYQIEQIRLQDIEDVKKKEQEALEVQRVEQEKKESVLKEQEAKIKAEQVAKEAEIKEAQDKIKADQEAIEAEKRAMEDAKQKVVDEANREKEIEEAKKQAVKDEKATALRLEKEKEAKAKKAEALKPDKTKVKDYIKSILNVTRPEIKDIQVDMLVELFVKDLVSKAQELSISINEI